MPRKMYTDFEERNSVTKPGKKAPWATMTFIPITCPHCKHSFVEIPDHNLKTSKASECLKHLRVCPEYKGTVTPAPEKKKEPSIAELLEQMKQQSELLEQMKQQSREAEARAQARHQEMLTRIGAAHGLPPPDPTSEEDLNRRLSDRHHEACKRACKRARREERTPSAMVEHLNLKAQMLDPRIARKAKALRACLSSDNPLAELLDGAIPTSGSKPDDNWNPTGSRGV